MYHSTDRWLIDPTSPYMRVPLYWFSIKGQLGVVIFFVISGYCITAAAYAALVSGKSLGRYGYERVRRIYPPYLAALALGAGSFLLIGYANAHHLIGEVHHLQVVPWDLRYWVANLFLLQYEMHTQMLNIVFWSLGYEVVFYLMIGLFMQGGKWIKVKRDVYAGTVFFVCALGVSTMLTLGGMIWYNQPFFPFDMWHQFSIGGLLFFLIELKPGTMSSYSAKFKAIVVANVTAVVILTLAFAHYCLVGEVGFAHPDSKERAVVCLVFAALLIGLRKVDERVASHLLFRPLMWVGAFSYSLYLVHPIVIPYIDILCRKAGMDGSRYWMALWAQVIVAVAISRVFYMVIERRFISKRQAERLLVEHVA